MKIKTCLYSSLDSTLLCNPGLLFDPQNMCNPIANNL